MLLSKAHSCHSELVHCSLRRPAAVGPSARVVMSQRWQTGFTPGGDLFVGRPGMHRIVFIYFLAVAKFIWKIKSEE